MLTLKAVTYNLIQTKYSPDLNTVSPIKEKSDYHTINSPILNWSLRTEYQTFSQMF